MDLNQTINMKTKTLITTLFTIIFVAACGGGGGGGGGASPAAKAAKKAKQAKAKLSFKQRKLSKMAAAGEDTTQLEAEIAELEALLAK